MKTSISRRHFLAGVGAAGVGAAFAGGMSPAFGQSYSGTSLAILPTQEPSNWKAVYEKANAKLQDELGFSFDIQFINWSNYPQQSLLKFTAGAQFDTALQALWLNMAQLQQAGSLVDLTGMIEKYPNLSREVSPTLIEANTWDGKLWGVPQVNSAGRQPHFTIRQDLAEKHGFSEIEDYETLERFFYAIKENEPGMTPWPLATSGGNYGNVVPRPTGMFNEESWENPDQQAYLLPGSNLRVLFAKDAAETGSSNPIPFWEDDGVIRAMRKVRQYYNDGIINADGITVDGSTNQALFKAGKFAGTWAITDGLSSNYLVGLLENVPEARLSQVLPFGGPLGSKKPAMTFQADNVIVVNSNGGDVERALALQDWLSVQENHDLIGYGIEGVDWEPVGEDGFRQLSNYVFPNYGILWRQNLERRTSYMTDSERKVFVDWAQDYDNFTRHTFSNFIPNADEVRDAATQMNNVITQYANPLFYGVVDVDEQLDKLRSAADAAGLDTLMAEMQKQGDAYLAKRKQA